MVKSKDVLFEGLNELLEGEDFILLLRAPDKDGGNQGVQLYSNAENAREVIKRLAAAIEDKVINERQVN